MVILEMNIKLFPHDLGRRLQKACVCMKDQSSQTI